VEEGSLPEDPIREEEVSLPGVTHLGEEALLGVIIGELLAVRLEATLKLLDRRGTVEDIIKTR